jgi:hypothetical protein
MSFVELLKKECEENGANAKFDKASRLATGSWWVIGVTVTLENGRRPSKHAGIGNTVKEAKERAAQSALKCDTLEFAKAQKVRRDTLEAAVAVAAVGEEQAVLTKTTEVDDLIKGMGEFVMDDDYKSRMTEDEYKMFQHEVGYLEKDSIEFDLFTVAKAIMQKNYFVVDKRLKTLRIEPTLDDALKVAFGDKPPKGTRSVWPLQW